MTLLTQERSVSHKLRTLYQSDIAFSITLASVFLLLSIVGVLHHEMWRDELENWLVPRDSSSLAELFHIRRYGGHPGLWYLILYPISRVTRDPFAMQLVHVLLASGAIFILARWSPFSRLQKLLFTFGYFPFFEYALISRNYVISELLIFALCALLGTARARPLYLSIILFLLANTTIYGLIIAVAITLALLYRWLSRDAVGWKEIVLFLTIVTAGIAASVLSVMQPPDAGFAADWHLNLDPRKAAIVLTTIFQAYVPIPNFFNYHFWNTNIFMRGAGSIAAAFISAGLIMFSVALFARRRAVLLLYLSGTLGILLFTYVKYYGYLRHNGNLFLLLIACLWLSSDSSESAPAESKQNRITGFVQRYKGVFITGILCLHIPGGIFAWAMDFVYPFSSIRPTADYIKAAGLQEMLVVASDERFVSPITGYLDKRFYYPDSERFGTHIVYNTGTRGRSATEILERARQFLQQGDPAVLLVLSFKLTDRSADLNVEELKHFESGIVGDEEYFLYRVRLM